MLSTRISRSAILGIRSAARRFISGEGTAPAAGSVSRGSASFGKREKAQEDMYAKQKEQEELKKLREQMAKMQERVDTLEKEKANKA